MTSSRFSGRARRPVRAAAADHGRRCRAAHSLFGVRCGKDRSGCTGALSVLRRSTRLSSQSNAACTSRDAKPASTSSLCMVAAVGVGVGVLFDEVLEQVHQHVEDVSFITTSIRRAVDTARRCRGDVPFQLKNQRHGETISAVNPLRRTSRSDRCRRSAQQIQLAVVLVERGQRPPPASSAYAGHLHAGAAGSMTTAAPAVHGASSARMSSRLDELRPSRISAWQPRASGLWISPAPRTPRGLCSAASRAVISEPLASAASTTSVAEAGPGDPRGCCGAGSCRRCAGAMSRNSRTSAPLAVDDRVRERSRLAAGWMRSGRCRDTASSAAAGFEHARGAAAASIPTPAR